MKIIIISITTIFVFFISLLTVKFWGKGQSYTAYNHTMLQSQENIIEFIKPNYEHLEEIIESDKNIYLDVSVTFDQKLVFAKRKWLNTEKPIHLLTYDEIKNDVILITDVKNQLKNKKIIFNLNENAQAIHQTFMYGLQQIGLENGENFIVTSQFEAPLKALKEIAPALVYGSTQPEILKIVAMQSMYLLEATTLRADVIIHPLKIHKHNFFNDEILGEMRRRHKKIIVGPINSEEINEAQQLHPFAVILNN